MFKMTSFKHLNSAFFFHLCKQCPKLECLDKFCVILDDLNFSLAAGCGLRNACCLRGTSSNLWYCEYSLLYKSSAGFISFSSLPTLPSSCLVLCFLLPVMAILKPRKGEQSGVGLGTGIDINRLFKRVNENRACHCESRGCFSLLLICFLS